MLIKLTAQGLDYGRRIGDHLRELGYDFNTVDDLLLRYDKAQLDADLEVFLLGHVSPATALKVLAAHLSQERK